MKKYIIIIAVLVVAIGGEMFLMQGDGDLGAPQPPTWEEFVADITSEQEALLLQYSDYVQVTADGRLLYKDQEINMNRFKNKIPANTEIHVYEATTGKGFQIIQRDTTTGIENSYGIGPEADSRTYTINFGIASST